MPDPEIYQIIQIPYKNTAKKRVKDAMEYFVVPYKKKYMIYFPLKGIVSLVNKNFVDKINSDDQLVKEFFNTISNQETVEILEFPEFIKSVMLDLTADCNLNCVYCYARGGDSPKYMDWKTAKAAIDWMVKRPGKDRITIEFHGGGEPTLAFPMIKKCYDYAKKKCDKKKVELVPLIATNGTLLTEDRVRWFKKINMEVMLSFDGTPDIQNKQRPFRNNSPSYNAIKKSIGLLNRYKVPYRVNACITRSSVSKMSDIIKHLHKLGVKKCSMSYNWEWGRCLETGTKVPLFLEFEKESERASKLARKYNIDLLTDKYREMKFTGLRKKRCGATGHSFIVTAHGDITSCLTVLNQDDPASKVFFYGKIKDGKVIINKKKLKYLRGRNLDNMKNCKNCFAKYSCLGICLAETFRSTGCIFKPEKKECLMRKEEFRNFLIDLFSDEATKKIHKI